MGSHSVTCHPAEVTFQPGSISKPGGHQGEARRAELRVEASRTVGGKVLGEGICPLPTS